MSIYTKFNYRKIYEYYYGSIPVDHEGRSYEIHHIDGNHSNNEPNNLKAVTIQEHYDIHYFQGDWGACQAIKMRMDLKPGEISNLCQKVQQEKVKNKTHHLLGPTNNLLRLANNNHPSQILSTCEHCGKTCSSGPFSKFHGNNCKHNKQNNGSGKYNELVAKKNFENLKKGIHPSQVKVGCIKCQENISIGNFSRHANACQFK